MEQTLLVARQWSERGSVYQIFQIIKSGHMKRWCRYLELVLYEFDECEFVWVHIRYDNER